MMMGLVLGGVGGAGYCFAMGESVTDPQMLAKCAAVGAISGFVLDYLNEATGDYIPLIDQTTYVGSAASGFLGAAVYGYARQMM